MSIWDSITSSVKDATVKTKLKADIVFIDRELATRKKTFGVELYDYVAPLSKDPSFYSSDDTLTVTLQPPLITAQREISALEIKQAKLEETMKQNAATRAAAFVPATTWQEKVVNAGKSAALGGNEAKASTEMTLLKNEIHHHKQQFGVNLYNTLEELEDTKQWIPTDREIRSIYDNCRLDIEKIKKRKLAKEQELETLEPGTYSAPAPAPEANPRSDNSTGFQPPPAPLSQPTSYGSTASVTQPVAPLAAPPVAAFGSEPVSASHDPFAAAPPLQQQQQRVDPFATATPIQQQQVDPFAAAPPIQQQQPVNPMFSYPGQSQPQQSQPGFPTQQKDPFAPAPQQGFPPMQNDPFAPAGQTQPQQQQQYQGFQAPASSSSQYDPFAGL